jgi:hypothetical protein
MRWAFAVVLCSGCAIGGADERGGVAYTSGGPVSETGSDEPRDDESSSDDGSDADSASGPQPTLPLPPDDDDDGSTGDATTGDPAPSDDTTTGVPNGESSTGAPDDPDPGVLPSDGPWSACSGASCDPGYACIEQTQDEGGVCTVGCVAPGDASACPAAPGEIVAPVCITVQGIPLCALDCSGGLQCPSGSSCVIDSDDNGAIAVCL